MPLYGYRLWAVDLHVGMKRERHEFGSAKVPIVNEDGEATTSFRSVDYLDAVARDVNAATRTHNFGVSKGDDDDGPTASTGTSLRFISAKRVANTVQLKVEYGLRHADGTLIDPADPNGQDIPLKNKSTLHPYRALLVTQPELQRGLLAIETRGRACPMVALIRGLRAESADGFRLRAVSHLAGEAAMLDFIANAEISRITFDQWTYRDDGARNRHELSMGVISRFEGRVVRDAVSDWCRDHFQHQRELDETDVAAANEPDLSELTADERKEYRRVARQAAKAEAARARVQRRLQGRQINARESEKLKQVIFANRDGDVTVDFTDVSVSMLNNGTSRIFNPLSDFQKLPYTLGWNLPTDPKFFNAAEETASNLIVGVQGLPAS